MAPMNLAPLVEEVGELRGGLVIVGSAALALRGVWPAASVSDLDLIVTAELYARLKARGWREVADAYWLRCAACDRGFVGCPPRCECGGEAVPVEDEPEPPWLEWDCAGLLVTAASSVPERDAGWRRLRAEDGYPFVSAFGSAEEVEGWQCASLELLRSWYAHAGRPKDEAKIAAIDEALRVVSDVEWEFRKMAERPPLTALEAVNAQIEHMRRRGIPAMRAYLDDDEECIVVEIAQPEGEG